MKGLELSKAYFDAYGRDFLIEIEEKFPALKGRLAAGLVGRGSECLGFDDDISKDHDFGPSFCVFMPEKLYQEYGALCQEMYGKLPGEFLGFPARKVFLHGQDRVGILSAETFYYSLLGIDGLPQNNLQWLFLPEYGLSQATNGEIFLDESGQFTSLREGLLQYYPEDVRRKKIAARAACMAQSGQYNYARLMKRGEYVGAELAVAEFIKETCHMVHLLNRKYTPFYKWMHRSLKNMEILPRVYELLLQLTEDCDSRGAWTETKEEDFIYGLNLKDSRVVVMETICQLVIKELAAQGISFVQSAYLDDHTAAIMDTISDPGIKSLQIMEG